MERRRGGSGEAWGRRRCGESELAAEGSLLLQSSENDRNHGYCMLVRTSQVSCMYHI